MWDYRRWEFCAGKSDRSSKGQLTGRLSGRREQDLWGASPEMSSSSHFEYYANTKEFYKSLATQSSLSASLQSAYSLGATVSVATKSKSSQQSEVKILGEVLYCSGKIWLPRNNVCEARIKTSANDIRRELQGLHWKRFPSKSLCFGCRIY